MIGLSFEDVNYALDGGLHAEMLENRNFEAKDVRSGKDERYTVSNDGGYAWSAYPSGASVSMTIRTDRPLHAENPHYLRLKVTTGGSGIKNQAYDGIYLIPKMKYDISFYARSYDFKGKICVGVYKNGTTYLEKKAKVKPDGKWHHYCFKLKAKAQVEQADFAVTLSGEGTVHLDCFSMIPENAIKGVFRRDLAELMKDFKPAFLRFPGERVVGGGNLANAYLWKESLGQTERRRHNWNCCALQASKTETRFRPRFSHYGQTLGVGFYEYFLLCEYLGCKPLPAINTGIACQDSSSEFIPLDDPQLEAYIQDALDLIEFANGDTETEWGRVREELGHPEPFNLEFLDLGSEYSERLELFEKSINEKYPSINIIRTDKHCNASPEWLYAQTKLYDSYPRERKVCAMDYAAHIAGADKTAFSAPQESCWESALAEAAFMTGMEQNADVVAMSSSASLFSRLDYSQFGPNLIWFDGNKTCITPSFHIQKLFSLYTGNYILKTELEGEGKVYATASAREGLTFLKLVNAGGEEIEAEVEGDFEFGSMTRIIRVTGELKACNTFEFPEKIVPLEVAPVSAHSLTLPPHSFSLIVFRK